MLRYHLMRTLAVATHEAAHIVVGVALGLRLRKASAAPWGDAEGYCWFPLPPGRRTWADAVTGAAGVAWERATDPGTPDHEGRAAYDWAELLAAVPSKHDAETAIRLAGALLAGLGAVHARVTRALLERDLSGLDIAALARGERLSED